jgi:hypothetical protein
MTDIKRIDDRGIADRTEALEWLADRVRWERLLTALREEPEVVDIDVTTEDDEDDEQAA